MVIMVHGKPQGKIRPRFGNGVTYTPTKTKNYEEQIQWCWRSQAKEKLDGFIKVFVTAIFEPNKDVSKKYREKLLGTPCNKKPDIDNIIKVCLDALNGLAYEDDKQVVLVAGKKKYGNENMVIIRVENAEVD